MVPVRPKANIDPTWWWSDEAFPMGFASDPDAIAADECSLRPTKPNLRVRERVGRDFTNNCGTGERGSRKPVRHTSMMIPRTDGLSLKDGPMRMWMLKRFLRLQRWGHGSAQRAQLRWMAWEVQNWLVDVQEGYTATVVRSLGQRAVWLQEARKAWEALGTVSNRVQALRLLEKVVEEEALPEILYGPQFWQNTTKVRQARYKALQKAHRRAQQAAHRACAAVEAYRQAMWAVREYAQRRETAYDIRLDELSKAEIEVTSAVKRMERIVDPAPFAKEPGQRGRQEKNAYNMALLGLESLFFQQIRSHRKAVIYTHCLLYVMGVCPDEDPDGTIRIVYRLRQHRSQ